jgi:tetratricopeptide (TPR) repeat protein
MATVSGDFGITLAASLIVSVLLSGCNTVMPVRQQPDVLAGAVSDDQHHRPSRASRIDIPLPRQAYKPTGEKVPYVPQANPYTSQAGAVPAEASAIFTAANTRFSGGDLEGAKEKFTVLTQKYPKLSGPWVKLGSIAEAEEKYPAAIENYRKAISINRNNVNAYVALGLLQRKQGYFSDAFDTYHDALAIWRDFPEAHLNLAILYDLYLNDAEEAQKHYEAYSFLTGEKDEKVQKWLVEVRHRTGIQQSFIDIPPVEITEMQDAGPGDAIAVVSTGESK